MKKPLLKRYLILFGVDLTVMTLFSIFTVWGYDTTNNLGMAVLFLKCLLLLGIFSCLYGIISYYMTKSIVFPALTFSASVTVVTLILLLGYAFQLFKGILDMDQAIGVIWGYGMYAAILSFFVSVVTKAVTLCTKKLASYIAKKFK